MIFEPNLQAYGRTGDLLGTVHRVRHDPVVKLAMLPSFGERH
jgi:hypothetical protein